MRAPASPLAAVSLVVLLAACSDRPGMVEPALSKTPAGGVLSDPVALNVMMTGPITEAQLTRLAELGAVFDVLPEIQAVILRTTTEQVDAVHALPFVASAELDEKVTPFPLISPLPVTNFTLETSTWNLDLIGITTGPGTGTRAVPYTGAGVYVGVLDSGLPSNWRAYFPEDRISSTYATTFLGGNAFESNVASPPGMWERDLRMHGLHTTSTIIGYRLDGASVPGGAGLGVTSITGVAPAATIIPVKVIGNNGSYWNSGLVEAVVYMARLKRGPLAASPVVVNMSLGGSRLPPLLRAALDDAVAAGVLVVAAAGNQGAAGMLAPGRYAPVISVAAAGWSRQLESPDWWFASDVGEPTSAAELFIATFSGRQLANQDLDVAAPGVSVLGPLQTNAARMAYHFGSGTSTAAPHVAGLVALMAEKNPTLVAAQAEAILESTALPLAAGCRNVLPALGGTPVEVCWGADATGAGLVRAPEALAATP